MQHAKMINLILLLFLTNARYKKMKRSTYNYFSILLKYSYFMETSVYLCHGFSCGRA